MITGFRLAAVRAVINPVSFRGEGIERRRGFLFRSVVIPNHLEVGFVLTIKGKFGAEELFLRRVKNGNNDRNHGIKNKASHKARQCFRESTGSVVRMRKSDDVEDADEDYD